LGQKRTSASFRLPFIAMNTQILTATQELLLSDRNRPFVALKNDRAEFLRGLVFRHCDHGAGERAVRLSQLI